MRYSHVRMVRGPARVHAQGDCRAVGADVSDSHINVREGKVLPFEPGSLCRLYARIGRGGATWWADQSSAGMSIWQDVAGRILLAAEQARGTFSIMLAGGVDTGKSTFCAYLVNIAMNKGITPCVIDGDIGQGDLAPPTAIGAAQIRDHLTDLRDATAGIFEFIGSISPAGVEQTVAGKIRSACDRSRHLGKLLIVNTDGYVEELGLRYKRMIADEIRPDIIACMGSNVALARELASDNWHVTNVPSSSQAQKSRTDRMWRRYHQFLRFAGDGHIEISASRVKFEYLGKACSLSSVLSSPLAAEGINNIFAGLGLGGAVTGFAIITRAEQGRIELRTDTTNFDTILLSNIRLGGGIAEQIN